jgi:hypothetical protein
MRMRGNCHLVHRPLRKPQAGPRRKRIIEAGLVCCQ